jgi:hypothetical protein
LQCRARRIVEITVSLFDRLVVVPLENHSAALGVPGDDLGDFTRISAIANQIAEKAKALPPRSRA